MSARRLARTLMRPISRMRACGIARMLARRGPATLLAALSLALGLACTAHAAAPQWSLDSTAAPTHMPRNGEAQLVVTARNLGDAPVIASEKQPVTFTDIVPAGVKPLEPIEAEASRGVPGRRTAITPLTGCKLTPLEGGRTQVSCKFEDTLPEYETLMMRIPVRTEEPQESPQPLGEVEIEGAKTRQARIAKPLGVEAGATPFGVEAYALTPELEGGAGDTQAGSHPFQLTTTLDFDQTLAEYKTVAETGVYPSSPALPRDLRFHLPPGLVGDPSAVAQCPQADFEAITPTEAINLCPADTAVGVAALVVNDPVPLGFVPFTVPVFNLEPDQGEPARFGFEFQGVLVVLRTAVPAGGEYGVEVTVEDASQAAQVLSGQVVLWGDPGDPSHDGARGWECLADGTFVEQTESHRSCPESGAQPETAFLTLPTSCSGEHASTMLAESWPVGPARPGETVAAQPAYLALSGCDLLSFAPTLAIDPEEHAASTPTGLNARVEMPQPGLLSKEGKAESAVRETTVALPEGLLLSPSAANGLAACEPALAGFVEAGVGDLEEKLAEQVFTPTLPPPALLQAGVNICPDAAKVGTVAIRTPLLVNELHGSVYLGSQDTAPFHSPLVLYLIAQDPVSGVAVKLAGEVRISATGRLTTMFKNTPQLPFQRLTLRFFGGPRASLSTPPRCGPQTASSAFDGWSGAGAAPASSFTVETGAGGGPCPGGTLPFAPSLQAGSSTSQAGDFTAFQLEIAHRDGDQQLTGVSMTLPQGMAAMIDSVALCPEPQASLGQCGPESQIGTATAGAGLGSEPFTQTGRVYLTGPYDGAPFGLSIVTPAIAGPFDLGEVVVRSAIAVDPHTAAVTVTSSLPTFVQGVGRAPSGVPLALKRVQVSIDRPEFQFNPTNCTQAFITGTLSGGEGAGASVSAPFTPTGCASLPFHPGLQASVAGHASKADGTTLTVKVTSQGLGVANIRRVDLQLPKQLPSRLPTLQKACAASVFEANPAACGEGSVIGHATIHTPILHSPLAGPAYLVSHGNAAFPDVEFVLQSEGIVIVLDGQTQIKNGITYSKFESAPDAPFTSFETVLPAGPHSVLTAAVAEAKDFDLCGEKLSMPTTIAGQNGAMIEQDTHIAISGCAAVKGAKARELSLAQRFKRALARCRTTHRHSRARRAGCERSVRARYTALALAACRKQYPHAEHKRVVCVRGARRRYGARRGRVIPRTNARLAPRRSTGARPAHK